MTAPATPPPEISPPATPASRARRIADDLTDRVPHPGAGDTATRWRLLADLTHDDIAVGRLVEAHLDARTILHEIDSGTTEPGSFWGVWAAEPPRPRIEASHTDRGWRLRGAKPWCSGVQTCTHALVTADVDDGARALFAVDLDQAGVRRETTEWAATGMSTTETGTVHLDDVPARPIGPPGAYLERPGFFHGGIGVAACWWGGARKVADTIYRTPPADDVTAMHLGAIDARLLAGFTLIEQVAGIVDAHPDDLDGARRLALSVRWSVEQVATEVIDRVARALGPTPLVRDPEHAQAVADLEIYLRQSHAERDLIDLGRLTESPLFGRFAGRDGITLESGAGTR